MKKILTVMLAGLLVVALTAPVLAWEFSLKGEYEYRFRYFSRTGPTDLFGNANLQETPAAWAAGQNVGFAGPNIYNTGVGQGLGVPAVPGTVAPGTGVLTAVPGGQPAVFADQASGGGVAGGVPFRDPTTGLYQGGRLPGNMRIVRGGFSAYGPDALNSDSRLTLYPEIRVNPAIRVHGVYNVGGVRHKYFQAFVPGYPSAPGFLPGVGAPAPGPAGQNLSPFERYYQSQSSMNAYDTAAIGSWEQFRATIQLPWGIWSIGVKDFPFGVGATLANNTRAEAFLTVVPYGPMRFLHGIWLSRGMLASPHESWFTVPDGDTKWQFFQGMLMTYDAGDLSLGCGSIWQLGHINRNEIVKAVGAGTLPTAVAAPIFFPAGAIDLDALINLAYMKYFNGRFFLNAEYAWANVNLHFSSINNLFGRVPQYREVYHWFSEAGVVAGPAKLTGLYALASGLVNNNGNASKSYRPWAINYQAMQPYQFLMFDTYAGGNNGGWAPTDVTFVSDDHGMMTDAYCYAARLDYAVASNLNFWGSYIWAHRLERAGTFAGQFNAWGGPGNGNVAAAQAWKALATGGVAANLNPYVDDGFIGWEANLGVDWKLLEGMTAYFRYSYWQPGEWFEQAYQAVGVLPGGGFAPTLGSPLGAIVKGRDAIQAFQGSLLIDF